MLEFVLVVGALFGRRAALGDGDDVEVSVLGDRHVPLELEQADEGKVVHPQDARHGDEWPVVRLRLASSGLSCILVPVTTTRPSTLPS